MKKSKKPKIAIIGWKRPGSWGNFCHRLFPDAEMLRDKGCGTDLAVIGTEADIIIVAVSLPAMEKTIFGLGSLHSGQLVVEFASRKRKTLDALRKTNAQVLSVHPLAGAPIEGTTLATDCPVVICKSTVTTHMAWVERFFKRTKAMMVVSHATKHDHVMLGEQDLVFEELLAYAIALERLGIRPSDAIAMRTKLSRKIMAAMARVLLNGPQIYADILFDDREASGNARDQMDQAREEVRFLLSKDSRQPLIDRMLTLRKCFGIKNLQAAVAGEFED